MDAKHDKTGESTANSKDVRPRRTGRKRTAFKVPARPAWPVRGLWENAPEEEKQRAHETCVKILEYWLGKTSKGEVARQLEVAPLRVWQLSQQALSGMLAGLLTQPRRRVGPEAFEAMGAESPAALKRRITTLEKDLSRTEDLVRVLRTAPWLSPNPESPRKGDSKRVRKTKPGRTARPKRNARANRPLAPGSKTVEGGASGGG
jgi:hypothetical protein